MLGWDEETLDSALASYHVTLGKYYHQPQFVQVESGNWNQPFLGPSQAIPGVLGDRWGADTSEGTRLAEGTLMSPCPEFLFFFFS